METSVAPGSGPRHFAFHPRGAFLYAVEELSSEITVFRWDEREGIPREIQTVSTLPEGFNGENLAADVHPTVDGRFLYCSNRGHNSIACFGVSADTGRLESLGHTPCGGSWPRNFALDPNGRFLFVANSRSDSIVRFQVNAESGALSPAGEPLHVGEPMCIKFSPLPAMQG
jgi:6-phosphogluconolactonase